MTSVNQKADVIIVGGGIVGSATAFFLRQRGLSVILLEQFKVGQQASGVNFGNVRRQGRFLPQLPLANRSREIWGRIPELTGSDVEFMKVGHVRFIWEESELEAIESYARGAREYGLKLEIIGKNALSDRFPFIGPEAVAASYSAEDGHANPRLAAPAFARAAKRDGATVLEHCTVVHIHASDPGFTVETSLGRFASTQLLLSGGAWASRLSAELEEPVPLLPAGPQMAVTEPLPYFIQPVVGVSTRKSEEELYLRQIPRGNVIFGGIRRASINFGKDWAKYQPDVITAQLRQLVRLVPALRHANIIRTWSGIESYFPDDLPVMGPSSRHGGLFYAFGFSGHGFQTGPGVGDVMAELIATRETSIAIDHYSIKRFLSPSAELAPKNFGPQTRKPAVEGSRARHRDAF